MTRTVPRLYGSAGCLTMEQLIWRGAKTFRPSLSTMDMEPVAWHPRLFGGFHKPALHAGPVLGIIDGSAEQFQTVGIILPNDGRNPCPLCLSAGECPPHPRSKSRTLCARPFIPPPPTGGSRKFRIVRGTGTPPVSGIPGKLRTNLFETAGMDTCSSPGLGTVPSQP